MVRGWVTIVIVLAVAGAARAQAPPVPGRPVGQAAAYPLPTDDLLNPPPLVPPRTSYQPARQPAGVPDEPDFTLPDGSVIPVPPGKPRLFRYTRRYGTPHTLDIQRLPDGTRRFIFTGGVIVNAATPDGHDIELATDDAVIWVRGKTVGDAPDGFQTTGDGKTEVEAYLSGNVIVRTRSQSGPPQTVRAAQVYYDVERERAVALAADLEIAMQKFPDPVHIRGEEIRRLDPENWEGLHTSVNASKLPSDPGLRIDSRRVTLSERQVQLRNVFGIPYRDLLTGKKVVGEERIITAYDPITKLSGVPVFYLPRLRTDVDEPLGPFLGFSFGQSRVFGTQAYTTWDMFKLLALKPPPGQAWRLYLDYLSARGPAGGTDYQYSLPPSESGLAGPTGLVKLYMIEDHGTDQLGGDRGPQPPQPDTRGRFLWRHQQEILEGLYFQGQFAYLSDKNFLEQYYKYEFDTSLNQETFAYLTYNRENFWAAGLVDPRFDRPWIAQTQWLPRFDGALVGQSILDTLVYTGRGSVAYAEASPAKQPPFSVLTTDRQDNTGRLDFRQELSVPLALGPVKLAPYGTVDLTGYSQDLDGDAIGRIWGGGGARATLPMTRVYEDVSSDLFNVRGLNHKVVFGANYLYARTNVPYTSLPLLDRLNDDATDQGWRNITPMQPTIVPGPNGLRLAAAGDPNSIYNPQQYAIRRLATSAVDTLDNIDVLQMDVRQRFQTKRGYPGLEHIVDLFTLDLSASYFPEAQRDNFGHPFSFLEYDAQWNVGDRVALVSTGWFEPYNTGSRYYTLGAYLNRPNGTNFYFGYRQIDPLRSKAVTGSVSYQLSRRYYISASSSYDFGTQASLSNSLYLTRTGTDLTVSLGFTYNSLVNNFGFQFMITPNLVAALSPNRFTGGPMIGGSGMSGGGR